MRLIAPILLASSIATTSGFATGRAQEAPSRGESEKPPQRPIFGVDRDNPFASTAELLVQSRRVAEELKLPPGEVESISKALAATRTDSTSSRTRFIDANTWVQNGTAPPEVLDRARSTLDDLEKRKAEIVRSKISKAQYRRLLAIAAQRRGYRSLLMPEVADFVEMSDEQDREIRTILDQRSAERSELARRLVDRIPAAEQRRYENILGKERAGAAVTDDEKKFMVDWFAAKDERFNVVEKFEDSTDSLIFNVLTRYQKKRFRAMLGRPVDADPPPQMQTPPAEGAQPQPESR